MQVVINAQSFLFATLTVELSRSIDGLWLPYARILKGSVGSDVAL